MTLKMTRQRPGSAGWAQLASSSGNFKIKHKHFIFKNKRLQNIVHIYAKKEATMSNRPKSLN